MTHVSHDAQAYQAHVAWILHDCFTVLQGARMLHNFRPSPPDKVDVREQLQGPVLSDARRHGTTQLIGLVVGGQQCIGSTLLERS